MKYKAYCEDNKIHLYFTKGHVGRRTGAIYELGYHLMDFSSWENDEIRVIFRELVKYQLELLFKLYLREDIERERQYDIIDEIDKITPYYHFYSQILIRFMNDYDGSGGNLDVALVNLVHNIPDAEELFNTARNVEERHFYSEHYYNYEMYMDLLHPEDYGAMKFFRDRMFYFNLALETIFNDFTVKKEQVKQELDYITNITNNPAVGNLSPMQRLYLLDYFKSKRGDQPVYINVDTSTHYSANKIVSHDFETEEELSNFLQHNDVSIVEMVDIKTIEDLIRFEIVLITKNELPIRRCKNCNLYFIPRGRVDSEYCHRRAPGDIKACNQVGAMKVYNTKFENDRIHKTYNRAYKRLHARTKNGNMSQEDFFYWIEQAKQWREKCYNEEIDFAEFERLLK